MGNSKRPFKNRYIFEKINSEEKAYWLGFLYADGSVGSSDNRTELNLAEKDLNHVEKFKNFIGLDNKISYKEKTKAYRYSFKDKIFKEILINKGCVPKKSLILEFPNEKQVPREFIRHFIRGYFDGDGCFCNTPLTFEAGFISTENFIRECLKVLPEEVKKTYPLINVHRDNGAKKYAFYRYQDVKIFLDFMYKDATIYLDRKYNLYLDFIENGSKKHKTKME